MVKVAVEETVFHIGNREFVFGKALMGSGNGRLAVPVRGGLFLCLCAGRRAFYIAIRKEGGGGDGGSRRDQD